MPTTPPSPSRVPAPADRIGWHRIKALLRRQCWRITDRIQKPGPRPLATAPASDRPLRIGFVVCEQTKWGLGSVLAELHSRADISVGFYPTLSDLSLRMSPAERRMDYARQRAFFARLGPIWADLYDAESDRMRPVGAIACDLAFIQQPWGMQDLPRRLSGRVRTAYVHYGMAVIANDRMQYGLPDFHPWLWRYYLPTQTHAEAIQEAPGVRPPALRVTGHPKFDSYLAPPPKRDTVTAWPNPLDQRRKRVIFAPHHGLERGSLALGTFEWSGPAMLDLARRHGDVDFLLRPHPNMAIGLARSGLMKAAEWQAYKEIWKSLPNGAVFEEGHYWEVFRSSDAMITDSGSFLAEYLPTKNPLIRLEREGAAPLNTFGQRLSEGFYRSHDAAGLTALFDDVVRRGHDPLAQARINVAGLLLPDGQSSAARIVQDILRLRQT